MKLIAHNEFIKEQYKKICKLHIIGASIIFLFCIYAMYSYILNFNKNMDLLVNFIFKITFVIWLIIYLFQIYFYLKKIINLRIKCNKFKW